MTDSMIDNFVTDAAGVDGNFQQRVQQINGDRLLSPDGKVAAFCVGGTSSRTWG